MKKIITVFFVVMLLAAGTAFAQWEFESVFPPDTLAGGTGAHGIAVDPDGKIWVQLYGATDSVQTADGSYAACRTLYVYNPDGTPASISGIKTLAFPDGTADTLYKNSSRGLATDNNGNILASHYDDLFRINYQTGEGMAYANPVADMTLTAASCDANGNVVVGPVIPGNPAVLLDPDLNVLGNVIDATAGYSRTIAISPDGNTVFWIPYTAPNQLWTRADEFSPFAIAETDSNWMAGMQPECAEWHPVTGDLWLSSGNFSTPAGPGYTNNTWYGIDVATGTLTDSMTWVFHTPQSPDERPRGIAFSPDGNTAYIGCFGATYPAVEKFVKKGVGVGGWEHVGTIDGYTLSQNYPNPFNPTTNIKFSVGKQGLTTLKVYDMLGREIATLLNENLTMGTYNVEFDGSDLPSGTYIYELRSGDRRLTEKMTLMK